MMMLCVSVSALAGPPIVIDKNTTDDELEAFVEMILRNQGLEILSNKPKRPYYRRSKYYPKRKKWYKS